MPVDLCLGDFVRDNALRHGDVPAYRTADRILTHHELLARATSLASALARAGLRRQDRVAVYGKNSIAFGEVLAAGWLSGVVVATVNFRLATPEVGRILRDAAPSAVFCDAEYLPDVLELLPTLTGVEFVVCLDDGELPAGVLGYSEFHATGSDVLPFEARPEDAACIIYTSGTTGRPKGCVLGQREMRKLAQTMNVEMRSGCDDRVLLVMPQFHVGAMAIGLGVHARGGTVVLDRHFDPASYPATVAKERVTVLHLAPTMLKGVLDAVDDPALLAGVRTVVYSAAPITGTTLSAALAVMPGAGFLNLYGQTEVITSGLPRELHRIGTDARDRQRLTSVGYPFPDTEVRIVDDEGDDTAPGEPGEIVVRTAAMFRRYWNDDVATAATIRDGWCRTGDIGRVDEEGLLYLIDRKKDVIISGGENVYSLEVEECLLLHPDVAACAVVGVPDERWGEAVAAVVVPAGDARPEAEKLREHVRTNLARYKAPRHVFVTGELPLLPTGKVDKKRLRAEYSARSQP